MSFYLSVTKSIINRKAQRVFYLDGLSVFLLENKENKYLFELPGVLMETPIARIIEYIDKNNITEAEILLPVFDEPLIDETFDCIAGYLWDTDATIGLLVEDKDFIKTYKHLIEKYGITYSERVDAFNRIKSKPKEGLPPEFDGRTDNVNKATRSPNDDDLLESRTSVDKTKQLPKKKIIDKTGLEMDKPFADVLIDFLNKSGKNSVDVYTNGGITRQVFSKILCNRESAPRKDTVICLAIGLELDYEKANTLIESAGYSLSKSIVSDAVVIKYLRKGIFDLDIINDELDGRNCAMLGWKPRNN